MVNGVREPGDCMTRFDEIVAFVDDTFADDASLGGFPGVLEARVTASKGKPARAQDGFYVLGTVTTVIETRLH
jgi:inosine/xanthosine triphosphate pyrophosphatase family protein